MRLAFGLAVASVVAGCAAPGPRPSPPPVDVAVRPQQSPAPPASAGTATTKPPTHTSGPRDLPACAPEWLRLVSLDTREWSSVEVDAEEVAGWVGVWTQGAPASCDFVIAVRADTKDVLLYANQCRGPGLWPTSVTVSKDRLFVSGHWKASTARTTVRLSLAAPDEATGWIHDEGPMADPDDPSSRGESSDATVTFRRRCK